MAKHVARMLLLSLAAVHGIAPTRRAALRHTAYVVAAAAAPANAKDLYYTKQDFCEQSDRESKNGIEFGCEQYVQSPEKRETMRTRSLEAVTRISLKLDTYRVETVASGALPGGGP